MNILAEKSIKDICLKVSSGGTPSRKKPEYYCENSNGHLWVKSKELLDKGIYDTEEKISDEGLKNSSAKYYPAGTILLAMYGANIGQLGWLEKPATVNQAVCAMVVDPIKADNKYLFYALLETREKLKVQAQGAAQQNLNAGQIKAFKIPYPTLDIQKKIASILSTYDDLIENNNRRIAILEEMAQKLYREWFVKFRFPGHEEVKMVESELGLIPEGWEVVTLSELYKTSSGGTPSRKKLEYYDEGTIPWVKTKELKDSFVIDSEEKITELGLQGSSAKLFPKYSVLMAMYGATIGQLGIISQEASSNQACCAIISKDEEFSPWYAYLYLYSNRDHIIGQRMGAAQQNISQQIIKNLFILKPTFDTMKKFNQIVITPLFLQIENLQKKNLNLKKQRDLLLPKLISGKITPP